MKIFGPCSFMSIKDKQEIIDTAKALKGVADIFRCKLYLGGTAPNRYVYPYDESRLQVLAKINNEIMPVAIEVHLPEQAYKLQSLGIKHIWIGARNSSNYSLLEKIAPFEGEIYIKRNPGTTIDEIVGIYDIMEKVHRRKVYIIERGINTINKTNEKRWDFDFSTAIIIKYKRPDIFERYIADISHSSGIGDYIQDHYKACRAINIKNFMVECTLSGKSKTDSNQMLSVDQVKKIIKGERCEVVFYAGTKKNGKI